MEMEAHLWKVPEPNVVLPRGLKIEEEEHSARGKVSGTSFFGNNEMERSIKHIFYFELKYNRSRQSYHRQLRTRVFNQWNTMLTQLL